MIALGVFASVKAFIDSLESICMIVGALAIAIPAIDSWIRVMETKHPKSRVWKLLDRVFFGCGIALVNIGKALDQMLAKKREIASGVQPKP